MSDLNSHPRSSPRSCPSLLIIFVIFHLEVDVVLLTYRSYATSEELLAILIERFEKPIVVEAAQQEQARFKYFLSFFHVGFRSFPTTLCPSSSHGALLGSSMCLSDGRGRTGQTSRDPPALSLPASSSSKRSLRRPNIRPFTLPLPWQASRASTNSSRKAPQSLLSPRPTWFLSLAISRRYFSIQSRTLQCN